MLVSAGAAIITPQRRSERAPQGSVSSLWTGVSKYHYYSIQVKAYRMPLRLTRVNTRDYRIFPPFERPPSLTEKFIGIGYYTLIARPACFMIPPFTSWCPGGAPYPAAAWFLYPQYRVFNFIGARKVPGKCAFHLTQK